MHKIAIAVFTFAIIAVTASVPAQTPAAAPPAATSIKKSISNRPLRRLSAASLDVK